jgi:hypothetical protein
MPRKKAVSPKVTTSKDLGAISEPAPSVEPNPKPTPQASQASKFRYPEIEGEGVRVRPFDPNGDAGRMYNNLASQPKVPCYCPLGLGEAPGAWQWYQANDLVIEIKKGKIAMVPQQVQETLMESLRLTSDAINPMVVAEGKVVPANIAFKGSQKEFEK